MLETIMMRAERSKYRRIGGISTFLVSIFDPNFFCQRPLVSPNALRPPELLNGLSQDDFSALLYGARNDPYAVDSKPSSSDFGSGAVDLHDLSSYVDSWIESYAPAKRIDSPGIVSRMNNPIDPMMNILDDMTRQWGVHVDSPTSPSEIFLRKTGFEPLFPEVRTFIDTYSGVDGIQRLHRDCSFQVDSPTPPSLFHQPTPFEIPKMIDYKSVLIDETPPFRSRLLDDLDGTRISFDPEPLVNFPRFPLPGRKDYALTEFESLMPRIKSTREIIMEVQQDTKNKEFDGMPKAFQITPFTVPATHSPILPTYLPPDFSQQDSRFQEGINIAKRWQQRMNEVEELRSVTEDNNNFVLNSSLLLGIEGTRRQKEPFMPRDFVAESMRLGGEKLTRDYPLQHIYDFPDSRVQFHIHGPDETTISTGHYKMYNENKGSELSGRDASIVDYFAQGMGFKKKSVHKGDLL